jgi:flagellar hook assembly protein FlgD
VTIELLDLSGRLVEEIDSRNMPAGVNTFNWNTDRIEAGTYFVRIRSELFSDTHPLIIRK